VAISGGLPEMLHGVAVLQMITVVIGAAALGPKLGTASGALVVGVGLALGEVWGDVLGDVLAVGELVAAVPPLDLPRLARMIPPMVPSNRMTTTAMTAGISQVGRSDDPPRAGLRATVGWRAGVGAGA
jgi:hypothetical protein